MKKLFLSLLISGFAVLQNGFAQVPTQEQLQAADAQLNQVYQQLRGSLNDAQKQQLKLAQRDWIKNRDAFVAANPRNPQGALYQVTMQRVAQISGLMGSTTTAQNQIEDHGSPTVNSSTLETKLSKNEKKAVNEFVNSIEEPASKNYSREDRFESFILEFNNLKKRETNDLGEISKVEDMEWLRNYQKNPDLSRKWPNENLNKKLGIGDNPLVSIQNKVTNTIASVGESKGLIAKSYIKDPNIYIYDTKTGIEILSFKAHDFIRDRDMTPIHLSFSKDGRLLTYTTGYDGLNGSNLNPYYVLNINSMCLVTGQFLSPIFFKANDGTIALKSFNKNSSEYFQFPSSSDLIMHPKNDYEGRLKQWESELTVIPGEIYNYDKPEDLIKRFSREDILKKDDPELLKTRDDNEVGLDGYINPNPNELKIFDIYWPEVFSSNASGFVNLSAGFLGLKRAIDKPSTIRNNEEFTLLSECEDLSFWPNILGIKLVEKKILNGYLNVKTSYCSDKIKIYALDYNHQGQQGRTLAVIDGNSRQPLALPEVSRLEDILSNKQNYSVIKNPSNRAPFILPRNLLGAFQERFHYLDIANSKLWISSRLFGLISININGCKVVTQLVKIPPFQFFAVSDNFILGVKDRKVPAMELWKSQPQQKLLDIYPGKNSDYEFVTPDGYYMGKFSGRPFIAFKTGLRGFPFEQFDLRLNRPDIVLDRLGAPKEAIEAANSLREKRLKRMGVTEEMLKPDFHLPELQIVGDMPAMTAKDQLDLQIKATDEKYPLDRLRVYVNNVPVNGRDGELLRDQKTQTLEKTIPIKLASGRNKIQVSVLNSAGAESLYANAEVNCTAGRPKPKLYAVALGVSQYDRPEWCLKYAAKDATDLINKIKEKAGSSYSEVKPLLLTDKEVTKESAAKVKDFLSGATIDDTILIFMAGHGILDDKYDYYFGTTDIDPAKPSERGMPYEAIDNILAEVPALKKALLMDTCHAGELDQDEKKELAASDGLAAPAAIPAASTNSSTLAGKVAMRSIGTRGMSVKAVQGAKGKSDWYEKLQDMFVDLRRGSGATVISSSQGAEYAFESSEQSNGLFTYALMEAIDGKATPNKDGQITISTVGDYVKKRVQDLTKGKQNPNLRGVNLEEDFAL